MKVALFLGAGASAFVDIPTTKELMGLVRERVEKRASESNRDRICQEYIMGVVNSDIYDDVEKLYDGTERIIAAHTNPKCKPIVGEMRDGKTNISDQQIITELEDLQSTIRDVLLKAFDIRSDYHDSIKLVHDKTRSAMGMEEDAELQVFTTNYDLVPEAYATKAGYKVVNGFKPHVYLSRIWDGAWRSRTDRSMYLTKLHGSVNWHKNADGQIIETGDIQDRDVDHDIMIAPTEGAKDYNVEPFRTLMDHFQKSLKTVDILLVIGFSYRDDEINEVIKRRLNDGMFLISVSPSALKDAEKITTARPQQVDWGGVRFVVLDSKMALCDEEFGPDTIDNMRTTLEAISKYFFTIWAEMGRTLGSR